MGKQFRENKVSRQAGKHRHVSHNTLTPMRKSDRERGEGTAADGYYKTLLKMTTGASMNRVRADGLKKGSEKFTSKGVQ